MPWRELYWHCNFFFDKVSHLKHPNPHSFKVFVHNTSPLLFFNIRAMSFMLQGTHEFLKGTTTDYILCYIALTSK